MFVSNWAFLEAETIAFSGVIIRGSGGARSSFQERRNET